MATGLPVNELRIFWRVNNEPIYKQDVNDHWRDGEFRKCRFQPLLKTNMGASMVRKDKRSDIYNKNSLQFI